MGEKLTQEEMAKSLDVTVRTLTRWRKQGCGPPWIQLGGRGGRVYYRVNAVNTWLAREENKVAAQ